MENLARRPVVRFLVCIALAATYVAGTAGLARAIIGGNPVNESQFPFYVHLRTISNDGQSGRNCGGTVIAPSTVLTAAHCVDGTFSASQINVNVRDANLETATGYITHPLWDGDPSHGHDLAIVRLATGATTGVTPVQVGSPWDDSIYAPGVSATIVGHGFTHPDSGDTIELRAVDTVIRSDDDMAATYDKWYWPGNWDPNLMIGAGNSDHTACDGDSGGPLVTFSNGHWIEVGVASYTETWPHDCEHPAVFSKMLGASLAWVALQVPAIKAGWGPCTTPAGSAGQAYSQYVGWFLPTGGQDGSYYWNIWCGGQQPTTTPTPHPTPTNTPPEDPPYCRTTPWKCTDR